MPRIFHYTVCLIAGLLQLTGCKKFLEVQPPINTITTSEMFTDNKQAEWAVTGIYSKMIHGLESTWVYDAGNRQFSAGLSTLMGGLSADEMESGSALSQPNSQAMRNSLGVTRLSRTAELWNTGFKAVYDCNAVLDGLAGQSAGNLNDSIRNHLIGETLTIRAFSYFYLVNFFGDLPLALSSDFNKTASLSRSPVAKIYEQIKADLIRAMPLLSADFSVGKSERVRINKWFAEALLARVYLYTKEYDNAITHATNVINQTTLFSIEPAINNVFLKNNPEAIFQLKPVNEDNGLRNATPEGRALGTTGATAPVGTPELFVSPDLLNSFETGDKRKTAWISSYGAFFSPAKYKVTHYNSVLRGVQTEYYTVMRLAELYLIRAEAIALGQPGNKDNAIDDLNVLRRRADVTELDHQLTAADVVQAVAHERRVELCMEWGHRWFDLKRTGKASEVLSQLPRKQPWLGDYQLLYPVPPSEINLNAFLIQNPEYTSAN